MTAEEESVQVDAYLDGLLAGRFGGPRGLTPTDEVDPGLEQTAGLVQRALARFHPSFTFEERLAGRLRGALEGTARDDGTNRDDGAPRVDDPSRVEGASGAEASPRANVLDFPIAGSPAADRRARGLLVGGAIASGVSIAGVSIAGAAFLVRRRTRPHGRARVEVTA